MATDPLAVQFDLRQFGQLIQQANSAAAAFDNLNRSANAFRAGSGRGGGGAGGGGGGSAGGMNAYQQARINVQQRRLDLQEARQNNRPQRNIGNRLQSLLFSTRFQVQNGKLSVSPLIGRTMQALGPEIAAIAAPLAAMAIAMAAVTGAAVEAAKGLRELSYATGSRGGTLGALSSLGSSMGIDLGAISQSFQSKITSDPMGRMFAARLGVNALPRPFGDVDEGKNLLTAIESLRRMPFQERLRTARETGLEGALPLAEMSEKQFQLTKQRGALHERLFGDQKTQTAVADFTSSLGGIGEAIQNFLGAIGKTQLEKMTKLFNTLTDALNGLAEWVDKHPAFVNGIISALIPSEGTTGMTPSNAPPNTIMGGSGMGGFSFGDLGGMDVVPGSGRPGAGSHAASTAAALDAVNGDRGSAAGQNRTIVPGVFGRGDRLRRAFPAAMSYDNTSALDINNRSSFRLGAY